MPFKDAYSRSASCATSVFRWPKKIQFLRVYAVIAGGFLVHLTLGTIYTFGNLIPYIVSYIRQRSHPADLHPSTGTWIYALALGAQGVSMFFGGLLERKVGPRITTLIGCAIMTSGVFLSSAAIRISFWLLLLTYGVLFGFGVGIAYVGPIACAMRWMPRWKGAMAGLVLAGFGLGALIFDPIQTVFINPHNHSDFQEDDNLLDRVPTIFLILGSIYVVLQVVGSLMIVDPPEDTDEQDENEGLEDSVLSRAHDFFQNASDSESGKELQACVRNNSPEADSKDHLLTGSPSHHRQDSNSDADEESSLLSQDTNAQQATSGKNGRKSHSRKPQHTMKTFSRASELEGSTTSTSSLQSNASRNVVADLKPSVMLKKANFYILWIMMLLAGFAVFFTATLYKVFGLTFIHDDHFLAIVGSASSIFNCTGRIVWGILADRISYKFSLVLQSGIMSGFLLTFYATSAVGKPAFFIWVCVIFFCIGGVYSLFPTAIARSFGSKYMSVNYGLLFTSQIISSATAALLFSALRHHLDWSGIIFLVGGLCLAGFVLTLFFRSKRYVILDLGGK